MNKSEIMSPLGHEGKEWGVRRGNVSTTIPFSDGEWISLDFHNFTEQEVCDLLDREFLIQLRDRLPELVEKCLEYAEENDLYKTWYSDTGLAFDFCGVNFKKNYEKSLFTLEFDAGDNPDEFQSEWMVSIGFDRDFRLTDEVLEESIWR